MAQQEVVNENENVEYVIIDGKKFEVQFDIIDNNLTLKLIPVSTNPVPNPEPTDPVVVTPTDPTEPKPVEPPSELGTVKPGGWGGDITNPDAWKVVQMRDDPKLSKIVDGNGINISTGYTSADIAKAVIDFVKQIGWSTFEKLLSGGTKPTEPTTGGGGIVGKNIYKTTGRSMKPQSTGFKIRHYASGKEDDTTIEFNAPNCPYDAYEAYGEFTIGKPEHDDKLDVKMLGPRHQDGIGAWYIFAIQFSDGETSFGYEQPHPTTKNSVKIGKRFGSIIGNKKIGFKGVVYPLETGGAHVEGYIDMKDGKGWQLALEADNPGGKKFKRDPAQQIQFRIDAAPELKGENVIVEEIVYPPVKLSGQVEPTNPTEPPVVTPTEPTTGEGWTSAGRWDNGQVVKLTGHMEMSPDKTYASAAGDKERELVIDGKGKASLSGHQGRIYIFQSNYDAVMQLKYIHTKELDNLSLKLRSRHQEKPLEDKENRYGGYGGAVRLYEIEFKRENYHNDHKGIAKVPLAKKLEVGKEYGVRYTVKDTSDGVLNIMEIDYGNGFEKVAEATDKDPLPYMVDKDLYLNKKGVLPSSSYAWIRINGKDTIPNNVQIWDVSIKPI